MKYASVVWMVVLMGALFVCGCQEEVADPNAIDYQAVNREIVDTYSDLAIQNAIIAQHTLYPYHFVKNGAQLNKLGERDLMVLIDHYRNNPGKVSLEQGTTDALLYQSRAQTVYEKMLAGGIPDSKIRIVNEMPGGEGIASNTMIEILEKEAATDTSTSEMGVEF